MVPVTLPARRPLPVLPGFASEILPVLALWWAITLTLFFTLKSYYLDIALVGTPTIIMLWPVGRALGLRYFSYRRPAFFLAIVTMWIIPATGFVLQSDASFTQKSVLFFALPPTVAFLGILVALPWAQAKPIGMFFRPDLLFGDGRALVGGTLMMVLGMRYVFAPHQPGVPWQLPAWNWLALAFGISGGIIPLILMRGMMKLLMRHMRLRDDLMSGYPSLAVRETLLAATALAFGFGFHNVFRGTAPFTHNTYVVNTRFWVGIGMVVLAWLWIVYVRGGFKRLIGEPFFLETLQQTFQKQLLFVLGWGVFFYGLMSMLNAGVFGPPWQQGEQLYAGLGFLLGGLLVLTAGRTITQYYQRLGMFAHWTAVLAPSQPEQARKRILRRVFTALPRADDRHRRRLLGVMFQALAGAEKDARRVTLNEWVDNLAVLPDGPRNALIASQEHALRALPGHSPVRIVIDELFRERGFPDIFRR